MTDDKQKTEEEPAAIISSTDWLCMMVGRSEFSQMQHDDVVKMARCCRYLLLQLKSEECRAKGDEEDDLADHLARVRERAENILHSD